MTNKIVEKDERTTFIENASYKFGYNFIAFALLLDVVYRSIKLNEAPWDLLGLIIISGFVMTIYQYKMKILGKTWLKIIAISLIVAFIIAFLLSIVLKKF